MTEIDIEQGVHILTSEEKLKAWGLGEWVEEADSLNFDYKGYNCLVTRVYAQHDGIIELGHLCGYMLVPQGHPWHGKDCSDIDCNIHGGLTFGERDAHGAYLIGFDCAHSFDICPGTESFYTESRKNLPEWIKDATRDSPIFQRSYKNMNFVVSELKSLVDQAIEAQSKNQSLM